MNILEFLTQPSSQLSEGVKAFIGLIALVANIFGFVFGLFSQEIMKLFRHKQF